jgi:5'-deoxynucleotidase YfbR-like HD superfamily hydrolase
MIETGWIQTWTGKKVPLLEMTAEHVDVLDVAHALSREPRFNGHTKGWHPYSVAQHSVYVSRSCSFPNKLWGLLHDASEAYVKDLPRPIKQWFRWNGFTAYDEIESRVMKAVSEKFGLPWPEPEEVKKADLYVMVAEARDLMSPLHQDWHYREENGYPAMKERIVPCDNQKAEMSFLLEYQTITGVNPWTENR